MDFTILNWNIGGAKYLEETKDKRETTRDLLNTELRKQIKQYDYPQVVTLQEVVRYGDDKKNPKENHKRIVDDIEGYSYYDFPLIETESLSAKDKWNKVKRRGDWPLYCYFAQGNAMLIRNDMPHFPVWDLICTSSFSWDCIQQCIKSKEYDVECDILLNLIKNALGNAPITNELINNAYLFDWNGISDSDNSKDSEKNNENKRLREFLIHNCNIDWARDAKIKKSGDSTIYISYPEKTELSIELNGENEITVKNSKYEKLIIGNDDDYNTIKISTNTKKSEIMLTLVEKKKKAFIEISGMTEKTELKVVKEKNDKLRVFIPLIKVDHIEKVHLRPGLYFGNRDTEPRCALVSHFIINPDLEKKKPLDIFVVNVHLTTLTREREGIPRKDHEASIIRLSQLEVIFNDIVSQYNSWRAMKFPEREDKRVLASEETIERHEPVWIIAGDFNFTPDSEEYQSIMRMNFMDTVPIPEGSGTKSKGVDHPPTLTVDYIFAGPKFISLDHRITKGGMGNNRVDPSAKGSDHFPLYAKIPLSLPEEK